MPTPRMPMRDEGSAGLRTTRRTLSERRPFWALPLVLAVLATLMFGGIATQWPKAANVSAVPEEEGLEIVSVVPATPRPGGTVRLDVSGVASQRKLELVLGGRPVQIVAQLADQLIGIVPVDAKLGHQKLRIAANGERSKAAHVDLATPLETWRLSNVLGAIALVLFGISSLSQGLQRTLSAAAARGIADAFRTPWRAAALGCGLGLSLGSEPLFGAGVLLAVAALGLGSSFAYGVALLALFTTSRFAPTAAPMSALAGVWLLLGLWYATVEDRRRLQSAGLVVLGFGALLLGVHLLHAPAGAGLVWLDAKAWAAFSNAQPDAGSVATVFFRSVLFSVWEQRLRGIEEVLGAAIAARAQNGTAAALSWGLALAAWLGALCGSLLMLLPVLMGAAPVRRAAGWALGIVGASVLLLMAVGPWLAAGAAFSAGGFASRAALACAVSFGAFAALARLALRLHRRYRMPQRSNDVATAAACARELGLGLESLEHALEHLCRGVRQTDRNAVDRAVDAIGLSNLHLGRAQSLAVADERLAAAASHALGMHQGFVTAASLVEPWLDRRILESAQDSPVELPTAAVAALTHVESHLRDGFELLQRALATGSELSLEEALQREIWIHASARADRPLAPFLQAFLQSLALVGHELYRVCELFGDDPVAPGRLALVRD